MARKSSSRKSRSASSWAGAGATIVLFEVGESAPERLAPFRRLASDFRGDLSLDPYSVPSGAAEAWSFVRGEDLSLQIIVELEEPTDDADDAYVLGQPGDARSDPTGIAWDEVDLDAGRGGLVQRVDDA